MQQDVLERTSLDPMRPVMPVEYANIVSDVKAHGDGLRLHEAFRWIRENHPLSIAETEAFPPFWVVTKHAHIRALATRQDLLLSGANSITLLEKEGHRVMREQLAGRPQPIRIILTMDEPDHHVYRSVVWDKFRPAELEKLREDIRVIAREFVDRLAATGGECDFASVVSYVYPLRVVMSLIGVPESDEMKLLKLAKELQGTQDPDQARAGQALQGADAAAMTINIVNDIFSYFKDLNTERLKSPRDDIASILAHAQIDGKPMPDLELLSYYLVLATAGHDTTSAATGGGMIELANNPDEFQKIKANPALVPTFVEESVRWVSPSKMTMRTVAKDFEMFDRQFKEGDHVGLAWASGSRDPEAFQDPWTFKVDRRPNRSMGFGFGPHVCIGQHLARMEMTILFEELFKRMKSVELAGETKSICSFQVSGPKAVPIRFTLD